jgi:hypothetical protein
MPKWTVKPETRRFEGPGPGGRDVSHGVNVYLRGAGGQERKIAVWYVRGEHEQAMRPREAVRPYLDEDEPPEHLLVSGGGVSVIG